jgi:hypothetical protein
MTAVHMFIKHSTFQVFSDANNTVNNNSDSNVGNEEEIEMMLESSPNEGSSTDDPAEVHLPDNMSTIEQIKSSNKNYEDKYVALCCILATCVIGLVDGLAFGSREHVGYGALITTILNAALISLAMGTLIMKSPYLSENYLSYVSVFCISSPIGIGMGSSLYITTVIQGSLEFSILTGLSRGILIYIGVVVMISKHLNDRVDMTSKVIGMFIGSIVTMVSCGINSSHHVLA